MSLTRDTRFVLTISAFVLVLISLPYMLAFLAGGEAYVFNGFLLNPIDGNSYLAKMYQGWEGNWRYKLAYSPQPGEGAYLFLFYLGLGKIARIFNTSNIVIFHLARLFGCGFLLWTLWKYYTAILINPRTQKFAFTAAVLGSGMGWLLISKGVLPPDFWVAETYPFLSSYANPHFPIGLSLALWLIMPPMDKAIPWKAAALTAVIALVLSVINPFGIVLVALVLTGTGIWAIIQKSNAVVPILKRGAAIGIFGFPWLIYYLWIANVDPAFSAWNAQNLTPSPPFWELAISLSPALFLGLFGIWNFLKTKSLKDSNQVASLVIWVLVGLVFIYLPVGLQRQFMMGLYIPVVGLSAIGMEKLSGEFPRRYVTLATCFFILAIPTNLIILLAAQGGIQSRDPNIYLTRDEMDVLTWITENVDGDAMILSGPEMGLYIPAYTGRRVIYGHPFETISAEEAEHLVLDFYGDGYSKEQVNDFILDYEVEYVLLGPREQDLGDFQVPPYWNIKFYKNDIVVYKPVSP